MNYDNLIQCFLETFPEFKEVATKESKWWDEEIPLVHIFFIYVLNPYLEKEFKNTENPVLLEKIFRFLEKMAISDDEGVQEVLGVTILERLGDDKKILEMAREKMGPNTLKMSHEIEKGWGRE
jgi:hypothetical protein